MSGPPRDQRSQRTPRDRPDLPGDRPQGPLRGITFDATGTLFRAPRLFEIYAESFRRHGLDAEPEAIAPVFRAVWQELACRTDGSHDRFTAHPGGPRGWWGRFIDRLAELLELPRPSRFLVAELYDRFARADAWELYPDTVPALVALRRAGLRLAVVSNWDERLERVVDGLGLTRFLDTVVYSSAIGYEKPDRRIFEAALDRLSLTPAEAAHAGDRLREDVEGALALGMTAVLVDRKRSASAVDGSAVPDSASPNERRDRGATPLAVASLTELTDRLVSRPAPT
jgi:putative hydrolase of the HAD superfamily